MRVRRSLADFAVCGLDLSLRNAAIAVIPKNWDMTLDQVRVARFGIELPADASEMLQVRRMVEIARGLVTFAEDLGAVEHAFMEGYAYTAGGSRAHLLAELVGTVRHLWLQTSTQLGYPSVPSPIPAASARKTILGKIPKGKGVVKKAVGARLAAWGCPAKWTEDEKDAFVVANEGRFRCGLVGLGVPAER